MGELVPYLALSDARAAMDWYAAVLGAEVSYEPVVMSDGRIGHAEMTIDGGRFMLADEHPDIQVVAPASEGSPVTLHLTVSDVDGLCERVTSSGVTLDRGPEDSEPAGRVAVFRDPFGHRWFLDQPPV